jgi:hypothetical protein
MYLILFSLCVYARLNKLEERDNAALRHVFSKLNSSKIIFISVLQSNKQNNMKAVSISMVFWTNKINYK